MAPLALTALNWSAAIQHCQHNGSGYVIATIINTQGSTPRDGGSKMVITAETTYDTIGGGQLEFLLVQQARELLAQNKACQVLKPIPLAAETAQCCGGNVTVMLEAFACTWQITLFGAGHVCQSLVTILAGLPCKVRIIDNRPELMSNSLPVNCRYEFYADPTDAVAQLPDDSWVIIFTHDHSLDFALCKTLLTTSIQNKRLAYTGLIGSQTKALRFRKRLADSGFAAQEIEKIYSPIGLPEVKGKAPMEVAVSIAAQLQSIYYQRASVQMGRSTSWREIKAIIQTQKTSQILCQ